MVKRMTSINQPSRLFFLPGAIGRMDYWLPAAQRIQHPAEQRHFGWPGFGPTPPEPGVQGIDDLVAKVSGQLELPSALIAQSMGGVVAIRAALRQPGRITHLVLTATSGGLDMAALGAEDWRDEVRANFPTLPNWFLEDREDLTARLPELKMPVLLLWGDADPISPVSVGEKLAQCLPDARLHVLAGGGHDLAFTHAAQVAALIDRHLGQA